MQQCSMLLLLLVFHLSSSRVTSRAAPASMDEESLSRACFDIGAEEISFFGSLSGGIDQVYCQGDMRFTMWEFAKLQQPNLNKPTRMDAIVATSTSLTVSSKYAFDSPQATNSGGSINVIVNYASDSPPNSTACQPSLPAPGACNYRSAARLCREYLTSPLRYCTVHLPILATLVMDPQLGDVTLSGVSGNFLLVRSLALHILTYFILHVLVTWCMAGQHVLYCVEGCCMRMLNDESLFKFRSCRVDDRRAMDAPSRSRCGPSSTSPPCGPWCWQPPPWTSCT